MYCSRSVSASRINSASQSLVGAYGVVGAMGRCTHRPTIGLRPCCFHRPQWPVFRPRPREVGRSPGGGSHKNRQLPLTHSRRSGFYWMGQLPSDFRKPLATWFVLCYSILPVEGYIPQWRTWKTKGGGWRGREAHSEAGCEAARRPPPRNPLAVFVF